MARKDPGSPIPFESGCCASKQSATCEPLFYAFLRFSLISPRIFFLSWAAVSGVTVSRSSVSMSSQLLALKYRPEMASASAAQHTHAGEHHARHSAPMPC